MLSELYPELDLVLDRFTAGAENALKENFVGAYLIAAIGTGFGGPTFMIAYQNDLSRRQLGAGVGLFSLCRQFGSSISTAVAGAIVGTGVSEAGLGEAVAGVVQQAFLLPTLAGAAVLISALLIPKTLLRATQREDSRESRVAEVAGSKSQVASQLGVVGKSQR